MQIAPEIRGMATAGLAVGLLLAGAYAFAPRSYFAGIVSQGIPLLAAGFLLLAMVFVLSGAFFRAGAGVVAFCAVAFHLWSILAAMPTAPTTGPRGSVPLKVVSFNLLNENRKSGDEILDKLLSLDADVMILMESRPIWKVRDRLREKYPYGVGCDGDYWQCGSMIVSRHRISDAEIADLGSAFRQRFLRASVDSPAGPITVVGIHLTKFYFDDFSSREIERAVEKIAKVEGPVVLGGDFNAAIWSRPLRDLVAGGGFMRIEGEPSTWPVDFGDRGIAIDHVLVRGGVAVPTVAPIDPTGSNHRGIVASLLVAPRSAAATTP